MSLLLAYNRQNLARLGVLKVWDGTDWRKVGCGGAGGTLYDGYLQIVSNTLQSSNPTFNAYYMTRSLGTSGSISVGITATDLFNYPPGIVIRSNAAMTDRVIIGLEQPGIRVDGTLVEFTTRATFTGTMRVDWTVSSVEVFLNGVSVATVSNSRIASNTYGGVIFSGQTVTMDNFTFGAVAGSPTFTDTFNRSDGAVGNGWSQTPATGTTPATTGRLRLWTGSGWVREACDDDSGQDTFTRSPDGLLAGTSTTTGGLTWTDLTGGYFGTRVFSTASGLAVPQNPASPPGAESIALLDLGTPDFTFTTTFDTMPTSGSAYGGILFRTVDNNNTWMWNTSGPVITLQRIVSGGGTGTAVVLSYTIRPATGDTLGIAAEGNSISVLHNGTVLGSTTDSTFNTATKAGIYSNPGFGAVVSHRQVDWSPVAHPLKIEDPANPGTWITVACIVPA